MEDRSELTDDEIDSVWKEMNGDKEWLRTFGYQQFARALLAEAAKIPPVYYDDLFDLIRGTGYVTSRQTREICQKVMVAMGAKEGQ